MKRWLLNLVKCETILIVAAILAVISCFFVPLDPQYLSYIHVNTISQFSVSYDGCVRIPAHWCVSIYWCAFAKACAH